MPQSPHSSVLFSVTDQKFDRIARLYDGLVYIVFGKSLQNAQCHFLHKLPSSGKILVMGGGSGWILEEIASRRPQLEITYLEASQVMIQKAQARKVANPVIFIHGNEHMLGQDVQYDAILTPFFLDLFAPIRLLATVSLLDQILDKKGIWIFTDFRIPPKGIPKLFAKALIYIMYRFFRIVCQIDARKLPDFAHAFRVANYEQIDANYFYIGMVQSLVLQKKN